MKRLLHLFIALAVLLAPLGCNRQKETPTEPATDSLSLDTVSPVDTLRSDTTEAVEIAPPPKKADEYFDDFVFAFMKSSKFQRSRIAFPLAHIVDGHKQMVERKQWRFDRMYSKREVYTLIFDTHKGMRLAKDTSIDQVLVEDFDFSQQRVKSYQFARQNGQWQLRQLAEEGIDQSLNADFYTFYQRFATDAQYREAHISDPLQFVTFDEDTFQPITGIITPNQWNDFAPELPTTHLTNIHYERQNNSSQYRFLKISTLSGGMSSTLTFRRFKEQWKLVKLEN